MKNFQDLFNERLFKGGKRPEETNVFFIDDTPIGSLGDIVALSGLPKAGKSSYLAGAIASSFTTYHIFRLKINRPENRKLILYVDTEGSQVDFWDQMEKIRKFKDRKSLSKELISINCRKDEPPLIIFLVEEYLKNNGNCSIVIIDGLLDLAYDYNNTQESKKIVSWLKKITQEYNVLIIGIIHTNKSNNTTVGHYGAYIDRAAKTVLEIYKEKRVNPAQFILKPVYLRSVEEFAPVAISCINGNWQLAEFIPVEETIIPKKKK